MHQHWTGWSADDEFATAGAPLEDSAFLRRARLYATALLYGNVFGKIEYDFGSGSAQPAGSGILIVNPSPVPLPTSLAAPLPG